MTAPTSREVATRLLAIKTVWDWLAKEERDLRDGLAAGLMVGERVPGALDPDDPDTLLGFVQLTKGRETTTVTDPAALLAWCEEHAPGEVVTTRSVRPAFITALLASVKADGGWIHPETYELVPVDGVDYRAGAPVLTVKATAEADALVAEALASRRLAIEPGGA